MTRNRENRGNTEIQEMWQYSFEATLLMYLTHKEESARNSESLESMAGLVWFVMLSKITTG